MTSSEHQSPSLAPPPSAEAVAAYQQARQLFMAKDFAPARLWAQKVVGLDEHFVSGWRLLADISFAQGEFHAARDALQQALVRLAPGGKRNLSVALHLATLCTRQGEMAEALAVLDIPALLNCNDLGLLSQAGYLLTLCEDHSSAQEIFERALSQQPNDAQLLFNCAAANRAMGNLERAEQLYDKTLSRSAQDWEVYKSRSDLRKQSPENNHVDELRELLKRVDLPAQAVIQLNYALAKELEDLQLHAESFAAMSLAANARRRQIDYQLQNDLQTMQAIAESFTAKSLLHCSTPKNQGEGMIFILGMPRTGSTLVDRILTAIPEVVSVGEPDTFARLITQFIQSRHTGSRVGGGDQGASGKQAFVREAAEVDLAGLGAQYERQLKARAEQLGGGRVIDKNPMNFLYLGLIRAALPAAKIIHLRRNPMDSCYAIYKTLFKSAYPFSYDQQELAGYYLGYQKLMAHWQAEMPDSFYTLDYESLIQNQEEQSRRLLAYCDIPWDDRCLHFYQNERAGTATASAAQVRQPVYASSVGKWKYYREQLQPTEKIFAAAGLRID